MFAVTAYVYFARNHVITLQLQIETKQEIVE